MGRGSCKHRKRGAHLADMQVRHCYNQYAQLSLQHVIEAFFFYRNIACNVEEIHISDVVNNEEQLIVRNRIGVKSLNLDHKVNCTVITLIIGAI